MSAYSKIEALAETVSLHAGNYDALYSEVAGLGGDNTPLDWAAEYTMAAQVEAQAVKESERRAGECADTDPDKANLYNDEAAAGRKRFASAVGVVHEQAAMYVGMVMTAHQTAEDLRGAVTETMSTTNADIGKDALSAAAGLPEQLLEVKGPVQQATESMPGIDGSHDDFKKVAGLFEGALEEAQQKARMALQTGEHLHGYAGFVLNLVDAGRALGSSISTVLNDESRGVAARRAGVEDALRDYALAIGDDPEEAVRRHREMLDKKTVAASEDTGESNDDTVRNSETAPMAGDASADKSSELPAADDVFRASGTPPEDGGDSQPVSDEDLAAAEAAAQPDAETLARYNEAMQEIDRMLAEGVAPIHIPGYVATGGGSYVYDLGDGLLIKMPRREHENATQDEVREDYIDPLVRGQGVEGLEQIKGFIDYNDQTKGAVIVERAEGTRFDKMTDAEKDAIPLEDFIKLAATANEAASRGIRFDYDSTNIFHGPNGFTIIDYYIDPDPEERSEEDSYTPFGMSTLSILHNWDINEPFPAYGERLVEAVGQVYGADAEQRFRDDVAERYQRLAEAAQRTAGGGQEAEARYEYDYPYGDMNAGEEPESTFDLDVYYGDSQSGWDSAGYDSPIPPEPSHGTPPAGPVAGNYVPERAAEQATDVDPTDHVRQETWTSRVVSAAAEGTQPRDIPGHIHSGTQAEVFRYERGIIAKVPLPDEETYRTAEEVLTEDYVEPLSRGKGVPGLEQVVDIVLPSDTSTGSIRVEEAPGVRLDQLSAADLAAIPDTAYEKLAQTCRAAAERELRFDANSVNLFYDPGSETFTVIDYEVTPAGERTFTPEQLFSGYIDTSALLQNWQPNTPFPAYGRQMFAILRSQFGDEAVRQQRERLENMLNRGREPDADDRYYIPDDL